MKRLKLTNEFALTKKKKKKFTKTNSCTRWRDLEIENRVDKIIVSTTPKLK